MCKLTGFLLAQQLICNSTAGKENVNLSMWQDPSDPKMNLQDKCERSSNKLHIVESNFTHCNTNVSLKKELWQVKKRQLYLISIVFHYCLQAPSPDDSTEQICQ